MRIRATVPLTLSLLVTLTECHHDITGPVDSLDLQQAISHGSCKGTGAVRYAVSPMAVADIGQFIPMGTMTGGHVTPVDHQYILPLDVNAGRTHYTVYAPFTGNIVSIAPRVRGANEGGVPGTEYQIWFEGSCTYWVYYDLVTQLSPELLAAGGSALAKNQTAYIRYPIKAGEVVGKIGGQTLDLGTIDATVTLPGLLVPAHYASYPAKIHTVDGLDYFDEPLRSQLLALDRRTALPRGGKIDFDIDGAAAGNWFLAGSGYYAGLCGCGGTYWTGHLALAYGNIDPALVVLSMGFPDGSGRQWAVQGNAPDPASVTEASGLVKWEVKNWSGDSVRTNASTPVAGVMLVQVLPARQMKVEFIPNVRAADVTGFSPAAKLYTR